MPASRNALTSKLFWELIDRLAVADDTALRLLGHSDGLTARGKRPRFTLTPEEERRLAHLLAVERLLSVSGTEPRSWLGRANRADPFNAEKPLDFTLKHGAVGIVRTRHFLEKLALEKSLR